MAHDMYSKLRCLMVGALVLIGCAGGGGAVGSELGTASPGPTSSSSATIRIDNNRPVGSDVTVFVVPEAGGIRSSLGTVQANSSAAFSYVAQPGYYVLEAASGTGTASSPRFRLSNGQIALWNMSTNRVTVQDRR
jgi:hypothetical protein